MLEHFFPITTEKRHWQYQRIMMDIKKQIIWIVSNVPKTLFFYSFSFNSFSLKRLAIGYWGNGFSDKEDLCSYRADVVESILLFCLLIFS